MASVVPLPGDHVFLQSDVRLGGQVGYKVVQPWPGDNTAGREHYYVDNGARKTDQYVPGIVWVNVEELPAEPGSGMMPS